MIRSVPVLLACVVLAGTAGCKGGGGDDGRSVTGPSEVINSAVGSYVLELLDGAAPPGLVTSTPCPVFVDSGTLDLTSTINASGESWTAQFTLRTQCLAGTPPIPGNRIDSGRWEAQAGGVVTFTAKAPSVSLNFGTGTVSGSRLMVAFDIRDSGASKRFTGTFRKQ